MKQSTGAYFIKFYPTKSVVYYKNLERTNYRSENGKNLLLDRKKAYKGNLSYSTKKVIEERLTTWYFIVEEFNKLSRKERQGHFKQLVFVTLTLSSKQIHDDKYLKETLLEQFLKRLKYDLNVVNYFWKAEKQENGNIHFHLVIDKYIDKDYLRTVWNEIQEYHGYLKDYLKMFPNTRPPSTDIKMLRYKKKAINYIMKYVSKENENNLIKGRVYSMSNSLVNLQVPSSIIDSELESVLVSLKKNNQFQLYSDTFFEVYLFKKDVKVFDTYKVETNYYKEYYETLCHIMYFIPDNALLLEMYCLFNTNRYLFNSLCSDLPYKQLAIEHSNFFDTTKSG